MLKTAVFADSDGFKAIFFVHFYKRRKICGYFYMLLKSGIISSGSLTIKSALYSPEKFVELEFLIKTLSDDGVVPEGFEELHNLFKEVINDE